MKVTVKRKKNASTLNRSSCSISGIKKPVAYRGINTVYHASARTKVIPRRTQRGA